MIIQCLDLPMLHDGKRDGEPLKRLPDRVSYVLAYLCHLLHRVTSRRRLHGCEG
jgi:hypothetical protein